MTYHPLSQDSGGGDGDWAGRRAEADRLVKLLAPYMEELKTNEASFVEQVAEGRGSVSVKMIFWLRDIWGRFA